jgi:hypothetical protein
MKERKNYRLLSRMLSLLFIVGLFVPVLWLSVRQGSATSEETDMQVYLPVAFQKFPLPQTIFGVEMLQDRVGSVIDQAVDLGAPWVRYNGIKWHEVEATQGVYDWSKLSAFESEIETLTTNGFTPIVIIRGTPEWARMTSYYNSSCGPIRQDALDDFANFVSQVATRYKNVKYWELGNEPDIDPGLISPDSQFGCWGNENDPYYGGGYYATMLKQVYPAIKQANPYAQVSIGGLLLDCDPTYQYSPSKNCLPAKFLEGILINGGGNYFDMVAYHAYSNWDGKNIGTDWDLTHPNWAHRGGALLGKLDFINTLLQQYSLENKAVIMNEGVLLCSDNYDLCTNDGFYYSQSNYAVRLYTRTKTSNLEGALWFTLNGPGWRYGGLLFENQEPRYVYQTYNWLVEWLAEADYLWTLAYDPDGLEGYAFFNAAKGRMYQVYWTNADLTHFIPKPANTVAVYDMFGSDVTPTGTAIGVTFAPIIIEMTP